MFFESWQGLGRVLVVGVLAYAGLVVLLRVSGKRTLSKWNAFDFVVTIALGSTLATIILSKDVALAEGILAFALLIALQYCVTWLSVRSARVRQMVKAEPTILCYRGEFLPDAMRVQRVTEGEIRAAIRENGTAALESILAVVLETDGSFSVMSDSGEGSTSALDGVFGKTLKHRERQHPRAEIDPV